MTLVGIIAHVFLNLALFLGTLAVADGLGDNKQTALVGGAVILAAIDFVGGGLLLRLRRPWSRGLGLGLMIGWALVTILTAGYCTGINTTLYTDGNL